MRGIITFTHRGKILGEKIKEDGDKLYINSELKGGVKGSLDRIFNNHSELIFICATGIAVRLIAPYLKSKLEDPAIVVIDDEGKFVISLLSGHIGGANILASKIAKEIGATPVITTASDNRGFTSLDLYFKENDLSYLDKNTMTKVMGDMVNDKNIAVINLTSRILPPLDYKNLVIYDKETLSSIKTLKEDSIIIICDTKNEGEKYYFSHIDNLISRDDNSGLLNKNILFVVSKNLNIGIGIRKGKEFKEIYDFLLEVLHKNGYTIYNILTLNSIDIKKEEEGLNLLSKELNIKFNFYDENTLNDILTYSGEDFTKSDFVKSVTGVSNVCETAALVNGGKLTIKKTKKDGMTIAIAKLSN